MYTKPGNHSIRPIRKNILRNKYVFVLS